MRVLVGYASTHGSTREIAERIAARLREQGVEAGAHAVSDVTGLAGYGAFVLGSAIHRGDWLPEAAAFLDRNRAALAGHAVWLFSVSTVGEGSSAFAPRVARRLRSLTRLPRAVTAVSGDIEPRGHHSFAGVVQPGDWGFTGRVYLRAFGGRFGDHRNWQEIDGWAVGIASQLKGAQRHPA